ncbi:MAG: FtsX-like permease family protein, partial [Lachnospiraceae bacterium]
IISRKQELAMMEAVGMTGKQQRQMLVGEGICYAVLTGIVSLGLSAVLNVTAIRNIGSEFFFFTWKFTVTPIFICLPFLAAIVYIVPTMCYRSMSKTSVVERIRRAE